jgi:HSP20 family protein
MANQTRDWMWAEALGALSRMERLQREMFRLGPAQCTWEPLVDVLETDGAVTIMAALPGVVDAGVSLTIESGVLVISGERRMPKDFARATIHRLELPRGRFERRVPLPAGRYSSLHHRSEDGCLIITLQKQG